MPISSSGIPCRCGSQSCWETEVGEDALLRNAGRDTSSSGRQATDEVLEEAAKGDADAIRAIETVGQWLGIGLAGLVNVLNPRRVVLGGLFARIYPLARGALEHELDVRAMAAHRLALEVVPSPLGADAPLIGAAELAFDSILADPTRIPVPG
jgi:predicted NBD/HSP70 family sugar kinase